MNINYKKIIIIKKVITCATRGKKHSRPKSLEEYPRRNQRRRNYQQETRKRENVDDVLHTRNKLGFLLLLLLLQNPPKISGTLTLCQWPRLCGQHAAEIHGSVLVSSTRRRARSPQDPAATTAGVEALSENHKNGGFFFILIIVIA